MNATNGGFPEELYTQLGRQVRVARENAGMTQAQLANALGLSRTSITNIEKGRQHLVIHTLYDIAQVLGTTVRELLPEVKVPAKDLSTEPTAPEGVTRTEWEYIEQIVTEPELKQRKQVKRSKERK